MSDLKSYVLKLSENRNEPEWLTQLRLKNLELYQQFTNTRIADSPIEKQYFDMDKILKPMLANVSTQHNVNEMFEYRDKRFCVDYDTDKTLELDMVVNGVRILNISKAIDLYPEYIKESMRYAYDSYTALKNAIWTTGIFVYVPDNTMMKSPVKLNTMFGKHSVIKRDVYILGNNSNSKITSYVTAKAPVLNIDSAVVLINDDAYVKNLYIGDGANSMLVSTKETILKKGAYEEWIYALKNFGYHFMDARSVYKGSTSGSKVLGAVIGKNNEVYESSTDSIHLMPKTTSTAQIKSALLDSARSIMRGSIKIEKTAKKSNAYYSGDALLLSKNASSITLPFLEIDGSGAIARHAATASNVKEQHIFYLLTRGIDEMTAKKLLISGFLDPVVSALVINEGVRFLSVEEET